MYIPPVKEIPYRDIDEKYHFVDIGKSRLVCTTGIIDVSGMKRVNSPYPLCQILSRLTTSIHQN